MNVALRCNFNEVMNLEARGPTNPAQKRKREGGRTGSDSPE